MGRSILKDKSYAFAILIVKLSQLLVTEQKEYVLSKADFIHKMSISLKEANETLYWIDLLKDTNYIDIQQYKIHYNLNKELVAMLVSSIKTAKSKL
ncbi:four helix bundle protein [Lacinutrix undariae]